MATTVSLYTYVYPDELKQYGVTKSTVYVGSYTPPKPGATILYGVGLIASIPDEATLATREDGAALYSPGVETYVYGNNVGDFPAIVQYRVKPSALIVWGRPMRGLHILDKQFYGC